MTLALATIARYFVVGIEAGICNDDEAREWSLAVIGAMDAPPFEIIEVSWHKPRERLIDDLNAVQGEADGEQAGNWLLGTLHASVAPDGNLWRYLKSALHVVNATGLERSLYYELDGIADELELAERGVCGTVAESLTSFQTLLKNFALPPFANGWSDIIFKVQS
ncbi:MAG: hypothetical protein V4641_18310 [Pseudomonadota bacterium]